MLTNSDTFADKTYTLMKISPSLSALKADGKAEIYLRIVISKSIIVRVKTHILVRPERFRDGKVIIPKYATDELRDLIDAQQRLAEITSQLSRTILTETITTSKEAQAVIERYYHPVEAVSQFWQEWREWEAQTKVSDIRRKRYKVVESDLHRFEDKQQNRLKLPLSATDLLSFETFLRNEHAWNKEVVPRGDSVIRSLLSVLRAFINHLLKTHKIDRSPFAEYTMPKEIYGTPYYLTMEERDIVADFDYGPVLNKQRDIFVFQCLVGCRVGDLLRLKGSNVVDGVLEYTPSKTKETSGGGVVRVPLNERAQEIVARYGARLDEPLLPFISAQKYNVDIKALLLWANIDRMVTVLNPVTHEEERKPLYEIASSHMARRTFIGNLYQRVQDPNLIGSMSGHCEGSRAFSRYRNIDEETKRKVVDLIK